MYRCVFTQCILSHEGGSLCAAYGYTSTEAECSRKTGRCTCRDGYKQDSRSCRRRESLHPIEPHSSVVAPDGCSDIDQIDRSLSRHSLNIYSSLFTKTVEKKNNTQKKQ